VKTGRSSTSRNHHCCKQAVEHGLPGGPWSLAFFTVKGKKEKKKKEAVSDFVVLQFHLSQNITGHCINWTTPQ